MNHRCPHSSLPIVYPTDPSELPTRLLKRARLLNVATAKLFFWPKMLKKKGNLFLSRQKKKCKDDRINQHKGKRKPALAGCLISGDQLPRRLVYHIDYWNRFL